jgi:hypothetical protein
MALISSNAFGTGRYYRTAAFTTVNLRAAHTICGRIKSSSTSTTQGYTAVTFANSGFTTASTIGRQPNGTDSFTTTDFGGGRANTSNSWNSVRAASTYPQNSTWYHFCLTYDTTNIRLYLDGTLVATTASATTQTGSSTSNILQLGGWHIGKLADAAFFNRALTAGEALSMASYRVPQVTSGLEAFYRLDTNANDSSGNARNATLQGTASGTDPAFSTADNPPQPETPTINVTGDLATSSSFAGQTTMLVTGALSSTSSFAGTATTTKPQSGALASTSAFAGTAQALLRGAEASTSAFDGSPTVAKPQTGALASTSAFAGALTAQLSGAEASTSAFAGQSQALLRGDAASTSAFAGTANVILPQTGALASTSAFAGTPAVAKPTAGDLQSTSALAGTPTVSKPQAGLLGSDSAFAGTLTLQGLFAGNLATSSALAGAPTVEKPQVGALATTSAFAGVANVALPQSGLLSTSSAFQGTPTITAAIALAGDLGSMSAFAGIMTGGTPVPTGGGGADESNVRRDIIVGTGRRDVRRL